MTSTINVSGQFVTQDGTLGLKTALTDVNYNEKLNFNLTSSTLLLCIGRIIPSRNATGIKLINKYGRMINFDIMILTAHEVISAC